MCKYFWWISVALAIAACSLEDGLMRGTQLKEITVRDKADVLLSQTRYEYNENGNLVAIRYPLATSCNRDIIIQYNELGRISFVGNDSLVYEDGHLIKTYYVGADTSYINAEYKIENSQLKEKIIYYRLGYVLCGDPNPHVIDTASLYYEYDAFGNVSKTSHTNSRIILFSGFTGTSLSYNAEFSHDSKVSPFADFPVEIKYILFLNSGPNNITGINYGYLSGSLFEYEYNLDDLPVKSKSLSSNYTTVFKYY